MLLTQDIIIFCAQYLFLFVLAIWLVAMFVIPRQSKFQLVTTTLVAGVLAYLMAKIAGSLYLDPRPFLAEHIFPLIPHAADNGFPSDHALLTMTVTASVYFFRKKLAMVMAIQTILVGFSRVLAAVHTPLDIVAAWAIGIAAAIAGYFLSKIIWRRFVTRSTKD